MRKLKFRVWDVNHEEFDDSEYYLSISGELIAAYSNGSLVLDLDFYDVEQFTGLKDINGVDIYEGDIVRDHAGVGEVQYSEIKGAFKVNYHDGFAKWFIDYNLKGERESAEVIGNIHENQELLED